MSLTITQTFRPARLCSTCRSREVLPAPRKPDTTVTGSRFAGPVTSGPVLPGPDSTGPSCESTQSGPREADAAFDPWSLVDPWPMFDHQRRTTRSAPVSCPTFAP